MEGNGFSPGKESVSVTPTESVVSPPIPDNGTSSVSSAESNLVSRVDELRQSAEQVAEGSAVDASKDQTTESPDVVTDGDQQDQVASQSGSQSEQTADATTPSEQGEDAKEKDSQDNGSENADQNQTSQDNGEDDDAADGSKEDKEAQGGENVESAEEAVTRLSEAMEALQEQNTELSNQLSELQAKFDTVMPALKDFIEKSQAEEKDTKKKEKFTILLMVLALLAMGISKGSEAATGAVAGRS